MARHESILDLIGNTPLVGVHALSPNPAVRIYAKLEGQNPGGSSKDRIALKMVEMGEAEGLLTPGATILEPSSGNTGIGLALVARSRGYSLRVVMPENVSVERRQLLEIFGAEVTLSPGGEGSNGAIRLAEKIAADEPGYVLLFQYGNPANPLAHYEGTGPEILARLSGGRRLRRRARHQRHPHGGGQVPEGAEPGAEGDRRRAACGRARTGPAQPRRRLRPPDLRPRCPRPQAHRPAARVDRVATRRLLDECGVFAGISSGAAIMGAIKAAATIESGTIVVLLPDGGWKYLSSGAWTDDLDVVEERAGRINYW